MDVIYVSSLTVTIGKEKEALKYGLDKCARREASSFHVQRREGGKMKRRQASPCPALYCLRSAAKNAIIT